MQKKPDSFVYAIALGALVVVGIITTTLINVVKNSQGNATDIRAKAGVVNTLKLIGTIDSVDSVNNTFTVSNVQFSDESRSGKAVNYGTWTVTPPATFSLSTAAPGQKVSFTVNSASFNVSSHNVTAAEVKIN